MNMADYLENKIVDWLVRAQSFTPPATVYVALLYANRGYSNNIRSTAVAVGDQVIPTTPNGHVYRCTTLGTTGSGEPAWPTSSNGTVTDGTAVWTEMNANLEANTNLLEISTSGSGYGRQSISSALANWAGTQGATTTAVSSGTAGTTSNNAAVTFGAPTSTWGLIYGIALYDAVTTGNLLFWGFLANPKQVNNGDAAPTFAISTLTLQIDN